MQFTCPCPATVELQQACGLPLGVILQPLAQPEDGGRAGGGAADVPVCWASDLARCARCMAYINPLCQVEEDGWACALCGCSNDFSTAASMRRYYAAGAERRAKLPELRQSVLDAACPLVPADPDEGTEEVEAVEAQPAVLALVDACWEEEGGLEGVKSALAAAVEALPPVARFGLVSFGSQVALHQVADHGGQPSGGRPRVVHQPASEAADDSPLAGAAPLASVLAPVATCRAAMLAAIEGLESEPPVGGGRQRALGDTLRAVLRWVAMGAAAAAAAPAQPAAERGSAGAAAEQALGEARDSLGQEEEPVLPRAQGFPGLRLLVFLSGPPNMGAGALVVRKPPPPLDPRQLAQAAREAADEAAKDMAGLMLDPAYPELSAWGDSAADQVQQAAARAAAAAQAAAEATVAAGDLRHAAPPGVAAGDLVVNLAAKGFYSEAGAAAAALGISCDVFAACRHWTGLELLEPLAAASGGTMLLYPSPEAAPLPQDVYKCVMQPRAFACVLRLRCSPELRLAAHHGRLTADREPGLYRMVACGTADTLVFELDRTERKAMGAAPAVQAVLQYSMLLPLDGQAPQKGSSTGSRYVLRRRIRILTAAMPLASTLHHMHQHCDAEATAALVVHKTLQAAAAQGASVARQMLHHWLVLLAARVADPEVPLRQHQRRRGGAQAPTPPKVDASLSQVEALQQVPHMVYALLRGPLLQDAGPAAAAAWAPKLAQAAEVAGAHWQPHPDGPAALRALLRVLPPDEAAVAVCPQLSSWSGPDHVAVVRHSLSQAALAAGQAPIWLLDTYSHLIVRYTAASALNVVGSPRAAPFPPPAASLLRRTLAGIRQGRRTTPELLLLRQGIDDCSFFDAWLIEDAVEPPSAPPPLPFAEDAAASETPAAAQQQQQQQWQPQPPSFVAYLEEVAAQAEALLQAGA